jgi:hypothetical protein
MESFLALAAVVLLVSSFLFFVWGSSESLAAGRLGGTAVPSGV